MFFRKFMVKKKVKSISQKLVLMFLMHIFKINKIRHKYKYKGNNILRYALRTGSSFKNYE